jgi:hypothetical protein
LELRAKVDDRWGMKSSKKKRSKQPKKRRMNQLERDTAAYFENMTEEEAKAERELEQALAGAAKEIDFDSEE